MKKIKVLNQDFYGCYWPVENSRTVIIGMFGDDTEDWMARSAVKWLQKNCGVNVLTMSPGKKDYGHHNLPIERFGCALEYLKKQGNVKFGICGASTTAMLALIVASYYSLISLTIALTPCDFVMEGFYQGNRDGRKEWPGEGESTVSWEGEPLPYLPFVYRHPEYWDKVKKDSKQNKDLITSVNLFRDSELVHPLQEEEKIKVERICGKLVMIGAEDDALWETTKYIRRMEERLKEHEHHCEVETFVYEHGTHFVFPEGMLKIMLPIGGDLMSRVFAKGREYPKECKETRIDIEKQIERVINEWEGNQVRNMKSYHSNRHVS